VFCSKCLKSYGAKGKGFDMTDDKSLMQFPCDFPIKIIGKNTALFLEEITMIIRQHFPQTPDIAIRNQSSQKNNYIAITATVLAHDQITLDALYQDLTNHPDIKMVL
jgi:putative lipoic acid-binding regulatory protein